MNRMPMVAPDSFFLVRLSEEDDGVFSEVSVMVLLLLLLLLFEGDDRFAGVIVVVVEEDGDGEAEWVLFLRGDGGDMGTSMGGDNSCARSCEVREGFLVPGFHMVAVFLNATATAAANVSLTAIAAVRCYGVSMAN